MKMGMRKPSLKKSIKAKTTGAVKRNVKKAVNPLYGKKGMGLVNDPKKAAYNKVYRRTTFGMSDLAKTGEADEDVVYIRRESNVSTTTWKACGAIMKVLAVVAALVLGLPGLFAGLYILLPVAAVFAFGFWKIGSAFYKKAKEKASAELSPDAEE